MLRIDYEPGDLDWETELTDDTLLELSGDKLEENMCMLQAECTVEADVLTQTTAFEKIAAGVSSAAWKKAEKDQGLGYNGQSQRTPTMNLKKTMAYQYVLPQQEQVGAVASCLQCHHPNDGSSRMGVCQLMQLNVLQKQMVLLLHGVDTSSMAGHASASMTENSMNPSTKLRAYLHSNKWSMNPEKLAKFTNNEMITKEADLYLKNVVDDEMPNALKRYIKSELFPCIQLKVGHGISLSTARCWLHREGFQYMSHKKGLYFDGHDRPDIVEYRQNVFLPAMKEFEHCLIQYTIGDVEKDCSTTQLC
ncbi:hypothetical protein DEU56DRAFT_750251 [Suillus clintonianus]|uniref:uncharacterized protein n=1 Tax=Suillus clintonianus TaxID=1904413 RepID=UPI001B87E9F1|nr:uncharacterized protein DEU56DRAFT_750251 [Suillus clintonianus]KAG2157051.1 hypothetical protein DEU56DRAFT_750251 [Suillus clintonianus]